MVEIERAGVKDHGEVTGLLINFSRAQGWTPEVDRDRWDRVVAELLNSDGWLFLLAREGDEPDGLAVVNFYLSLYGSREQARLISLIVEEDYRRQGTGTMLMEAVFAASRRRGCRELEVRVEPEDEETLDFYRRFDFTSGTLLTWPCSE